VAIFAAADKRTDLQVEPGIAARSPEGTVATLAKGQIFYCGRPMYRPIRERDLVGCAPWTVPACMALPQSGLVETVYFGYAPFQVYSVALAALIGILLVRSVMLGQPVIRMLAAARKHRGLIVCLATTKKGAADCCHTKYFGPRYI